MATSLRYLALLQRFQGAWRQLSLGRKLYAIAGIALLPSVLLLFMHAAGDVQEWTASQRRQQGLGLLDQAAALQGEVEAALEAARRSADLKPQGLGPSWEALAKEARRLGDPAVDEAMERLDGDWQTLLGSDDPELAESALRGFRDDLPRLSQRLTEARGLTRDDSLVRLGLARAAGSSLPALEAQLSRLRDLQVDADRKGRAEPADLRQLELQQHAFSQQMAQALQDLESAFAAEDGLKARLIDDFGESPFGLFQISADRYAAAVQEHFDAGARDKALRGYCGVRFGQLLEARAKLYERLHELLQQRHQRAQIQRLMLALALGLLTALLLLLSLGLARWGAEEVLQRLLTLGRATRAVAHDGDLSVQVEAQGSDEVADLARDFNAMVQGLAGALQGLDRASAELRRAVQALREAGTDQEASIVRQASALHQALVTSEEIRQTSGEAARRAQSVRDQALGARAASMDGGAALADGQKEMRAMAEVVQGLRSHLAELPERLSRTEAVAAAVKELAIQSNVLALNAAIEALRAGEQGRSFGLVAREMRNLADRSAEESRRVGEQLAELAATARRAAAGALDSGDRLGHGLERLTQGLSSLEGLAQAVEQGSEQAAQIAEAVREQGLGLDQLLLALGDQSALMRHSEEGARKVAELCQPLLDTASEMERRASHWRFAKA